MTRLFIATNNGDVSGGEIMMFALARAARELGLDVAIVAPRTPEDVCRRADEEGFDVVRLAADSRPAYIEALARFAARHRRDWFWCNGLVPSFALTGHARRINHLHQIPVGVNRVVALPVRAAAEPALVPSGYAASRVSGTVPFPNWVEQVPATAAAVGPGTEPLRLGFMGRLSVLKGTDRLARAVGRLLRDGESVELHLAGDYGHIPDDERRLVEAALAELPDDALVRHGKVDPADFYRRIHALAVPSDWGEVFGLVAAEAMSARVPLLVTDDGGLPEVVGGEHPWVVPAGDDDALLAGLRDLLAALRSGDPRIRASTEAARDRWNRNWSPAAGLERVRDVLSSRTDLLGA